MGEEKAVPEAEAKNAVPVGTQLEFDFGDVELGQRPNGRLTLEHKESASVRRERAEKRHAENAIQQAELWADENGIKYSAVAYVPNVDSGDKYSASRERAYNGGAVRVDEFKREMRGKGEGAAAHGRGVYVAFNE